MLDLCSNTGLKILNGRILGDTAGKLTCHKYNGSSTVDLALAHHSLFKNIQYLRLRTFWKILVIIA
jgi:hypothetical protein